MHHFLLVVCSKKTIWHRFPNITTFTVYVTGCDLEKSFVLEKIEEIAHFPNSDSCVNIS